MTTLETEIFFCKDHPDRPAAETCTLYPCNKVHLCEECSFFHGVGGHGSQEVAALDKTKTGLVILGQEIDKQIQNSNEIEARLEKNQYKSKTVLEQMKEIHRRINLLKNDQAYLSAKLDIELKLLMGARNSYRQSQTNYIASKDEIENHFNSLKSQYNELLYTQFSRMMSPDLSNILPYFDNNDCSLILLNINSHIKVNIPLKSYGIKSCKTFTCEGGPTVLRAGCKVYIFGGYDKPNVSNEVFSVSFNRDKYRVDRLPNMKYAKYNSSMVVLNNRYIYVIGGACIQKNGNNQNENNVEEKYLGNVEMFDIVKQKWIQNSPLNIPRANSGACVLDNRFIYVYGGKSENNQAISDPEIFDTLDESEGWKLVDLQKIPNKLENCAAAIQIQASLNKLLLISKNSGQLVETNLNNIEHVSKINSGSNGFDIKNRTICRQGNKIYFASNQSNSLKEINMVTKSTKELLYF